jgi:colanic acid biosynthesis glycosyl transferase WcaI
MRILFIAHYFQPEPNFFVGLPFAKKLIERGHEVEVLTGFPNYPEGRVYDGYRIKLLQREILDGVPIIRVPSYPSHEQSSVKRILSYTSLSLSQAAIGPVVVKPADVAYVSQGPATIGLPACVIRLLRRIPFVYDIKDLWPDVLESTGMFNSRLGLKLVDKWCKFVYRHASKIVVITPGVKQKLLERGVPEDKIAMIYEWCDDSHICYGQKNEQLAKELGMEGRFNILFAGNMGKAQAMTAVLDAAAMIQQDCPQVQIVLIGSGVDVDNLKQKAQDLQLENVRFLKRRPISEIGAILSLADVLFVHLKDDPIFRFAVPSKTQAYMASGRPILMGVKGDAAELVKKAQAGLSCEPQNAQSIAEAFRKLATMHRDQLEKMGENGRRFYEQKLSFDIGVAKYEDIFKSVAKK